MSRAQLRAPLDDHDIQFALFGQRCSHRVRLCRALTDLCDEVADDDQDSHVRFRKATTHVRFGELVKGALDGRNGRKLAVA